MEEEEEDERRRGGEQRRWILSVRYGKEEVGVNSSWLVEKRGAWMHWLGRIEASPERA